MRCTAFRPALVGALAALGTAACLGGCASPVTRHHVLSPVVEPRSPGTMSPASAAAALAPGGVVGVGPVRLPAYLDRPQIVARRAPDVIEVMEFEQWGEPLRDGVTRVLAVNLARLLPDSLVLAYPWRSTEQVRYHVVVDVAQMDGPADGSIALDARWRVLDRSGRELAARTSRVSEQASAGTTAAAVSRALGALSREIADELRSTDRGRP